MNLPEPLQADLDPALEHLMSELDDALFDGRPTGDFEHQIAEQFGAASAEIVATLKALHSVRPGGTAHADQTQGTAEGTTWVRATSGLAKTVFGRFEILERLGSGGAGTVFRARDSRLGRLIALKVARAEALFSSEAKQRFVREAQTLAALRHPNIIPIYEFGESGGLPYIVEELCDGPNLAIWLRDNAATGKPVSVRSAVEWIVLLAEAVAHAHRSGIVHRDLKPSNVLLSRPAEQASEVVPGVKTEKLVPRVSDFGIAKLFETEESVTASQAVLGTAAYMAPEQAEGRSREVGPPADVYSLGVILYELLTGQRPIEGRSEVDTLRRVLTDEPLPLRHVRPDVPPDLEAICLKCLDKNFSARYPSAAELADDLRCFLKGEPVSARRLLPVARLFRQLQRRRIPSAVAVGATLILAALVAFGILIIRTRNGDWIIWQTDRAEEQKPVAATRQGYVEAIRQADIRLHRMEPDLRLRQGLRDEARQILINQIPGPGVEDCRGFEWYYLWKLAQPQTPRPVFKSQRTVQAHKGVAYFVSFSPDNRFVATGSNDNTARVWDVRTGKLRATFSGHSGDINCLAFSPDGKILATASDDGSVRLWDMETATLRKVIWRYHSAVIGVAFNPANGHLACAAADGRLSIFDIANAKLLKSMPAHPGAKIDDVSYSFDGKLLATAGRDGRARLWNPFADYQQVAEFPVADARSVGFSHDKRRLAVGSSFGVHVFRISTGEIVGQFPLPSQKVRCVHFTEDDSAVLSTGDKAATSLIDLTTGESWDPFGTSEVLWCLAASPDEKQLATTDGTGTLVIWDAAIRRNARRVNVPLPSGTRAAYVAIAPDGMRLAIASNATSGKDNAVQCELGVSNLSASESQPLFNVGSGEPGHQMQEVAFAPDGEMLAYGEQLPNGKQRIRVVDAETGKLRCEIAGEATGLDYLLFSPGGSILVCQQHYGAPPKTRLEFRNARTGAVLQTIPVVSDIAPYAISTNENVFATAGTNHESRIQLFQLPNPHYSARLEAVGETIRSVTFSKDGHFLIGRGGAGYVVVWSRATGAVVRQFTVPGVFSVAGASLVLSPDGQSLALGSKSGVVLADFESGRPMCTLPFPHDVTEVRTLAFTSDGRTILANTATAKDHLGIYLWQTGENVLARPGELKPIQPANQPFKLEGPPPEF